MLKVDREQVLAYRIAAHELHRPHGELAGLAVLLLGVQDAGQVSARLAIAARLDADPAALAPGKFPATLAGAGLTMAWSHRGAPHLHHAADLPTVASALVPLDDGDARSRMSWQRRDVAASGMPTTEALTTAASALHDVVDETMTKGAASEAVTKVLPPGLTLWCRGCQATHIHEQLMRLATLRAGVRLEPDVSPATLTPVDGWGPVTAEPDVAAGVGVVEEYLRLHGPATQTEAAGFVGTTKSTAQQIWPEDLVDVDFDGKTVHLAKEQIPLLENPPEPALVRLLPPSDPLLQSRDRLTLVPDKANHKAIWRIIGNPGAVLADGEFVATWRAKAKGRKRLELTVTPLWTLSRPITGELEAEAARLAAARGFPDFTLTVT